MTNWNEALQDNPMIAILRGLPPDRAIDVAGSLDDAGFRILEVPLNSPDPLRSIERIAKRFGDRMIVGAGTVLTLADVDRVRDAGGRVIVAPNISAEVGQHALETGLIWCPGVFSPTEAFHAFDLGASVLKFFPAEVLGPTGIKALRAVLPPDACIAAVGGVTPMTLAEFGRSGANAFGLGSALYQADMTMHMISDRARAFAEALAAFRDSEAKAFEK